MTPRAHGAIHALADRAIVNANLERNVRKGDWMHLSIMRLFGYLLIEVAELAWALVDLWWTRRDCDWLLSRNYDCAEYHIAVEEARSEVRKAREAVRHEAGDCCCFLAFILERVTGRSPIGG